MYAIENLKKSLLSERKRIIVFPEADDSKIQNVALKLYRENLIIPLLIFKTKKEIPNNWPKELPIVIEDKLDKSDLIEQFVQLRKDKTTLIQATALMNNRVYIGTMLVKNAQADGMVCGLTFTTADTLRPALQIIKTKPEYKLACSVMWLKKQNINLLFADCALNLKPSAEQLVDITKMVGEFALKMNVIEPQAVLLSYSTKGSGLGEEVERIQLAMKYLRNEKLDFIVEGEMQFDAAFNQAIRNKKAVNNKITKAIPDIYIFPDLQSGNIGYKIAQYLGDFEVSGPYILGLNKPINDLSRGADEKEIFETAIVTAYQSLK